MTEKIRFTELDIYKGIAILLIILGHCFCSHPVDFRDLADLQHYIATFNLNMFFVASGILFSTKEPWGTFFTKKVKRLLIPWFVFVVLSICFRLVASSFTNREVTSFWTEIWLAITTGKYYWFLYALFIMMCVTKAIRKLPNGLLAVVGGGLLVLAILDIYPITDVLCIKRLEMYYPWFLLGVMIKNTYKDIRIYVKKNKIVAQLLSVILILACTVAYLFINSPVVAKLIMPLAMCLSIWGLSFLIADSKSSEVGVFEQIKGMFVFSGTYSLQYYLNHLLVLLPLYYVGALVFGYSQVFALLVIFILAVVVSTIMLYFERKIPYMKYLCGL